MDNAEKQPQETTEEQQNLENQQKPQEQPPNANEPNQVQSSEQNAPPSETQNDKQTKTNPAQTRSSIEESAAPLKESIARLQSEAANNAQRKRYQAIDYLNRQYELREWIEKVFKKPTLDPSGAKSQDSPDWDLRKLLQNGVIVCQLMKIIVPDSIPHIHEASNLSSFKGKENISHFINAVEEFGVPRHRLFEVNDLFLGRNFFKVVECIEHVGAIAQAKGLVQHQLCEVDTTVTVTEAPKKAPIAPVRTLRPGASGIKTSSDGVPKPGAVQPDSSFILDKRRSWTEAQLKQAEQELSSVGGWRPRIKAMQLQQAQRNSANVRKSIALNQIMLSSHLQAQADADQKVGPKVRGTIDSKTILSVEKSISMFQAMVRGRIARRKFQKRLTDAAYREKIVREILETEEVYVANLTIVIKNVLNPLKECIKQGKPIIKMETLRVIFSDCIEVILNYNLKLLQDLRDRVNAWGPNQAIGDIFLQFGSFLKVYTQYVKDQPKAQAMFDKKKTKKKFNQWLWERKQAREITMELDSYLILPIQRVPRYTLLLDNLGKHTWPEHPDYINLRKAAAQVADVANYINERKRDRENIDKITVIMKRITGKFENLAADPRRRFVMEGSITVIDYLETENSANSSPNDTLSKSTSSESLNSANKQMKPKDRNMYLFNDKLLLTKSNSFPSLLRSMTTATEKFKLIFDVATISFKEEQHPTTFSIYSHDILTYVANGQPSNMDSDKLLLIVVTSSKEERDQWVTTFQRYKSELLKQISRSHEIALKQSQDKADEAKNALAEQYGLHTPATSTPPKESTLAARLKRAATMTGNRSKLREAKTALHGSTSSDDSPHATNTSDPHGSSSPNGSFLDESESVVSSPGSSAPNSRRTSNADMLRPDSVALALGTPPSDSSLERKSSQNNLSPEPVKKTPSSGNLMQSPAESSPPQQTEAQPTQPAPSKPAQPSPAPPQSSQTAHGRPLSQTHSKHTPPAHPLPPRPPGAHLSAPSPGPQSNPLPPGNYHMSAPPGSTPPPSSAPQSNPAPTPGPSDQQPSSPDFSGTKVTPEMAKQLETRNNKDRTASFSFRFKSINRSLSDIFTANPDQPNNNQPVAGPASSSPQPQPQQQRAEQPATQVSAQPPQSPQPSTPASSTPAQSPQPAEQGTPLNPNNANRSKKSWRSFFADQK